MRSTTVIVTAADLTTIVSLVILWGPEIHWTLLRFPPDGHQVPLSMNNYISNYRFCQHTVGHTIGSMPPYPYRNGHMIPTILQPANFIVTNLLSSLGHLGVHKATSIQTFDFSTLYTSIPHDLLKSRMNNIINNAFKHKNGATRYTHIKVGRNKSHFTSDPSNGDNKYTANDICKMIEFLVDNIYVRFGGQLFRQMVGIPMGTNCAPLLADLFLYSYENEFLDKLIKEGKRKLARRFNLSYRYIDDLISFNNKRFKEFISDIYPKNSQFLKPQNLLQLLLISICFSREIEATI